MVKCKYLLIVVLPVLIMGSFITTDDPLQAIISNLENFRKDYRQEKVYLHLDKPYYAGGDTMFIKGYIVDGERNLFSAISNILHIDLINEKDSIVISILLPVEAGSAWGQIALPDSLQEGIYRLRSYTSWMRNFNADFFFDKTIIIGNISSGDVFATMSVELPSNAQQKRLGTEIRFNSFSGLPISEQKVTYTLSENAVLLKKGTLLTDEEGKIKVEFPDIIFSGKRAADLVTNITLVNNTVFTKAFKIEKPAHAFNVRFFPEGGQLVSGLLSKCGFKAVGFDGLGIPVSGYIMDKAGIKITEFKSGHAGLGNFYIIPAPGNTYTAFVKFPDSSEKKVLLPQAVLDGFVLSVENSDKPEIRVRISSSKNLLRNEIVLLAQSNNVILYAAKSKLSPTGVEIKIPSSKFPTGIVQFTLFNADHKPVAERLTFVNHNDHLNLKISSSKKDYTRREKVSFELESKNDLGEPVLGNFSVSVTDKTSVDFEEKNERTIFTELLITSDLRGYIEKPAYYFTDINLKKINELDNLMLIHGWRKFMWNDIIAGKYPTLKFQPEKNLSVSGTVTTRNGELVAGARMTLISRSGDGFILDTISNQNGRFIFDRLPFIDSAQFIIRALNSKGKSEMLVKLDDYSAPKITTNYNRPDAVIYSGVHFFNYLKNNYSKAEMYTGDERKDKTILKEVVVKGKKLTREEEALQDSRNLNGPGNADQVFTYLDLINCNNLPRCLQGKLLGVTFTPDENGNLIAYSTRSVGHPPLIDSNGQEVPNSGGARASMLVVVDGIVMQGMTLSEIPAQNVQSVEVLRSGGKLSTYGFQGIGGVIVITTKKGGIDYYNISNNARPIPGAAFSSLNGYNAAREFYSPDHSKTSTHIADTRTTIYWNPIVITDETGKATIKFFNADATGTYRVVVEGISFNGETGRQVYYYTVK